jgi:hypothetical protein
MQLPKGLQLAVAFCQLDAKIERDLRADPHLARGLEALNGYWAINVKFSDIRENIPIASRAVTSGAFVKCVDRLGGFDRENLAGRFAIAVETAKLLESVAGVEQVSPESFVVAALRSSGSRELAPFYFVAYHFVVPQVGVQGIISKKELRAWFIFEKAILAIIRGNHSLSALFFALCDSPAVKTALSPRLSA